MTTPSAQGVFNPKEALQSDIKRHAPSTLHIFYCQKRRRDGALPKPPTVFWKKNMRANKLSWGKTVQNVVYKAGDKVVEYKIATERTQLILVHFKIVSKQCILKALNYLIVFFLSLILFNLYYFEYLYDVLYEAESALCNINKHQFATILKYILQYKYNSVAK